MNDEESKIMGKIGLALRIFTDIDSPAYTEREKAWAVWVVMGMSTHNGIKKDEMLEVIRWLWNQHYEIED